MQKLLFLNVGTTKTLSSAIITLINHVSPTKTIAFVTPESEEILEDVLQKIEEPWKQIEKVQITVDTEDPRSLEKFYRHHIVQHRGPNVRITADITFGKKVMAAALMMAAVESGAETITYVGGQRRGPTVEPGAEAVSGFSTALFHVDNTVREAIRLYNRKMFGSAANLLQNIGEDLPTGYKELIKTLRLLFELFHYRDRFNYTECVRAFQALQEHKTLLTMLFDMAQEHVEAVFKRLDDLRQIEAFLQGQDASEKASRLLAGELFAAAELSASIHRYDDAVARYYRLAELLAQMRLYKRGYYDMLKQRYQLPEDAVELPEWLKTMLKEKRPLGLLNSFYLLKCLGLKEAENVVEEQRGRVIYSEEANRMFNERRNRSILAHGFTPLGKEDYQEVRNFVLSLAQSLDYKLEPLLKHLPIEKDPSEIVMNL